ncbi:hypothetical protein [Salinicoccus sp. HZC-1]|uniref:hypothetical protein n=1 Tax=Salinicoccus sp. HZC-1 TaxID=3385497 RepID=UPI00398B716D
MFGLTDLISLVISAFLILPAVILLRELGYLIASTVFGAENPRVTLGSGGRLFKVGMFDVRKYYHLYSWFSYDKLKYHGNFAYIALYLSPILMNVIVGLIINALLANGYLQEQATFWNRFIFYTFYYVLFDSVPMRTINGMPNNGMIIFDLIRHGKRVDHNKQPFLPSTTGVEEEYQEEMEELNAELEKEQEEKEKVREEKEKEREEKEKEREKRKT